MMAVLYSLWVTDMSQRAAVFLLDAGVKGLLVLALAVLVNWALRRKSASARHLVWTSTMVCLVFLPVVSMLIPKWHLPVLPKTFSVAQIVSSEIPEIQTSSPKAEEISMVSSGGSWSEEGLEQGAGVYSYQVKGGMKEGIPWALCAILIWLFCAVLTLARPLVGFVMVARLRRRARELNEKPWQKMLQECRDTLRVKQRVELLQSEQSDMPITWGILRPGILVPCEWSTWRYEKQWAVLLHELAHIKRQDCLTQALARLAVAIHWFNPLVWVALRRLRVEHEQACDDVVVMGISRPTKYADYLLEVAHSLHRRSVISGIAIAMTHPSRLEGRVRAILDATRNRRRITERAVVFTSLIVVCVLLTLSSVSLVGLGNSISVYAGETKGIEVTSAGLERKEVIASPLTPEEGKIVDLLASMAKDAGEKFPDNIKLFQCAVLYHVHSGSEGTAWVYLHLVRKSGCGEDEVSWGSSMVAHAKAEYYLPNGTALRSSWEPRGNGMYDTWIGIERVVSDDEWVPVICRYVIGPEVFLTTLDSKVRYVRLPTIWDDRPRVFIVRLDKPLRLKRYIVPSGAKIERHEDFTQLACLAPSSTDSGAFLVGFVGPFDDQKDATVRGKYGEKDIVLLPIDKREHPSQNVTREIEMAIRSDAARAGYNMRKIHQAWLRDASSTFVDLASTLPSEILNDPFNLEGGLQCFIASDPRFVVLTSIGPDGERDISKERIPDVTSVRAMRRKLGMITFDPTNGTFSSGDIIRIFDLKNPSDRQEY